MGEHDEERLNAFAERLASHGRSRVDLESIWRAYAETYPERADADARSDLASILEILSERDLIRLPATRQAYDRLLHPALPSFVHVPKEARPAFERTWKQRLWHPALAWINDLKYLPASEEMFLMRVHESLVNRAFSEPAPLKYRSLQLTGDEKRLQAYLSSRLFAPGRLSLSLLNAEPDAHPLAWARITETPVLLLVENGAPYFLAERVLRDLPESPYGAIAYGAGNRLGAVLRTIASLPMKWERIHYVGDLDWEGLLIARRGLLAARERGLPAVEPAPDIHRLMLKSAADLGHPTGWPVTTHSAERPPEAEECLTWLPADVREPVAELLALGRRIPEEALGPNDLRRAWRS